MVAVPSIGRASQVTPRRAAPEADATRDLYERYARQIYAYCHHQLGNREEAEDATQSTFLNAFRGFKRGVDPEFESAWLYKIAQNVCLTRQRSSSRRRRVESPGDLDAIQDILPSNEVDSDELIGLPEALAEPAEAAAARAAPARVAGPLLQGDRRGARPDAGRRRDAALPRAAFARRRTERRLGEEQERRQQAARGHGRGLRAGTPEDLALVRRCQGGRDGCDRRSDLRCRRDADCTPRRRTCRCPGEAAPRRAGGAPRQAARRAGRGRGRCDDGRRAHAVRRTRALGNRELGEAHTPLPRLGAPHVAAGRSSAPRDCDPRRQRRVRLRRSLPSPRPRSPRPRRPQRRRSPSSISRPPPLPCRPRRLRLRHPLPRSARRRARAATRRAATATGLRTSTAGGVGRRPPQTPAVTPPAVTPPAVTPPAAPAPAAMPRRLRRRRAPRRSPGSRRATSRRWRRGRRGGGPPRRRAEPADARRCSGCPRSSRSRRSHGTCSRRAPAAATTPAPAEDSRDRGTRGPGTGSSSSARLH